MAKEPRRAGVGGIHVMYLFEELATTGLGHVEFVSHHRLVATDPSLLMHIMLRYAILRTLRILILRSYYLSCRFGFKRLKQQLVLQSLSL